MRDLIVFEPIAMERVWGGRRLESLFGKILPHGVPTGELWEIVDREDAQSLVHTGRLRGHTLNDLWINHRTDIFGSRFLHHPSPRFPLLIKLLDARERLSVQVHPPRHMAAILNGEPKTEMWYFLDSQAGANIYAGLKEGVTREHFEDLVHTGRVEESLHKIPVSTGESIFIPSGRLHAIGAGNVIIEVQQNSDTTYRVFDWNRMGLDGQPRSLHIDQSMASIDFDDCEPQVNHAATGTIAECEFFRVEKLVVNGPVRPPENGAFAIYAVTKGELTSQGRTFRPAEFVLFPATGHEEALSPVNGTAEVLQITMP